MFCYQIATSNAAQLCNELGQQTVILEGDAKQVVDAITGRGSSWSRYGHIVEDIRVMLQAFSSWECVHVSRERLIMRLTDWLKRLLPMSLIGDGLVKFHLVEIHLVIE